MSLAKKFSAIKNTKTTHQTENNLYSKCFNRLQF